MSHPELDPRDAEIARLKEQLRCMRSREEMAIQLLQNIAEAIGYEVCENPQFLAPEIAGLVKRFGELKQQLAAAESEVKRLAERRIVCGKCGNEVHWPERCQCEGSLLRRVAAAESALAAEQALSEQRRAALACVEFIDAGGHPSGNCPSCGWSKSMRHRPGCQLSAALALTPTDALRKGLLEVAEKAYNEGWLRDAFWQASETRRALEEEK